MRRTCLLGGLLVAQAMACSARPAPQKTQAPPAKPATTKATPSASPEAAKSPVAQAASCTEESVALNQAALNQTIRGWLSAQNIRDFKAYSAFYADHFTGLLKSGDHFARVDRKAWLARHQSSLAALPATAKGPQIALGAGGAQVTLAGVELFFVASKDGPKITWQAPLPPTVSALSTRLGLWLADEGSALLDAQPDATWAEGVPTLAGPNRATRGVNASRLPKALRAWLGRPVKVLGANGAVCETRLQRFALRAQITPDLRTAEHWEGCADGPAIPAESIAQDIWNLSAVSGRSLIAEFSAPCKGALLAVDPDLPAPPIAAPQPASADLGERALSAFRQLPAYAQIQARFHAEEPDAAGAWDDHDARRSVSTLELPGQARLVFVSVAAGSGCANFSAALGAIWQGEGPSSALLAIDDQRLTPNAVVDLDGTGSALLLGPDGLFGARSIVRTAPLRAHEPEPGSAPPFARVFLSSAPFFAGPC